MLVATHSTWVEGAKKFARWLAKIPCVEKVRQGEIRNSHVKPGKRSPELTRLSAAVRVTYFYGGQAQFIRVYPKTGVNLYGLQRGIKKALQQREQRGGIGQSPKENIPIPEKIRRKMEMDLVGKSAVQIPATTATEVVRLTTGQGEAYKFLLDMMPKDFNELKTTGLSAKLVAKFGKQGLHHFTSLKTKGLISVGAKTDKGKGGIREKEFTIFRREFEIYDRAGRQPKKQGKGRTRKEKPERKAKPGKPLQTSAPSQIKHESIDVDASFRVIAKHVKRLLDGGYEVEIKDGKLSLNRKL